MTNHNNSYIQTNVMRRVHIIHALQPLLTMTAFSVVLFLLAGWGIGREVWVARVFQNMPSPVDVGAVVRFYLAAFINTRFIVQALSLITIATFIWITVSIVRTLRTLVRFA